VKKKSQKERLLEILLTGETISQLEALQRGCGLRIAARIKELRDEGHDIRTIQVAGQSFVRYQINLRGAQLCLI
jgi:biotin operon repressor